MKTTLRTFALFPIIIALECGSTFAQVGADKRPTTPPKETTTATLKKTPARKTSSSNRRTTPSGNQTTAANERVFWNSIKDSTDPADFKEYLEKYPNGQFVGLAQRRLAALTNVAAPKSTPDTSSPANTSKTKLSLSYSNQAGIEFVLIPPGSFTMGSTNGGADERPVHQVTINYSFYMGKYEVTHAQWQAVMGNNPWNFKEDNLPVERVSWQDANAFIARLNARNDGFSYRLPAEAEWEYACRAGTTGDYAGDLDTMAWYGNNSGRAKLNAAEIRRTDPQNYHKRIEENGGQTHEVGTKIPNAFGLFDMHGNVAEWCQDWYQDSYSGAPPDGSAYLSGGEQKYRVLRGASWASDAADLRSASRVYLTPAFRPTDGGFRVVAVARTQ